MEIKKFIAAVMALMLVGGAYPSMANKTSNVSTVYAAGSTSNEIISDGVKYVTSGAGFAASGLADNSIKDLVIPDKVKGRPVSIINKDAFKGTSIESVVIGANVNFINNGAFENCIKLKEATLNDKLIRLDMNTFRGCTNLVNVTVGKNLEYIGDEAFFNCQNLSEFTIGDKVTSVGTNFLSRTAVKELVIPEGVKYLYGCPTGLDLSNKYSGYHESAAIIIKDPKLKLSKYTDKDWDKCLIVCSENSLAHDFAVENSLRFCTPEQYESGDYEKFVPSQTEEPDDGTPSFNFDKIGYRIGEPINVTLKNISANDCHVVNWNVAPVDSKTDKNGNTVLTYKASKSGMAKLLFNYNVDGNWVTKEFTLDIIDEVYEDKSAPKFTFNKESYKINEPVVITAKNIANDDCEFNQDNIKAVSRKENEDGSLTLTFKAAKNGEGKILVHFSNNGEFMSRELRFTVTEEFYEDESAPQFSLDKDTYKRNEPITLTIKNIDADYCKFDSKYLTRISDYEKNEDGSYTVKFNSITAGEDTLYIEYRYKGIQMTKQFPINITDDDTVMGDANCDGSVDMSDVVLIMQSLANPNKYGINGSDDSHITQKGLTNGDVDTSFKGITGGDALKIQRYLLGYEKEL